MSAYFAQMLKLIRNNHGISQEDMSVIIERSAAQIGLYEQNRAEPPYEILQKIISKFDIDANTLFEKKINGDRYTDILYRIIAGMNKCQKRTLVEHLCAMMGLDSEQFEVKDKNENSNM